MILSVVSLSARGDEAVEAVFEISDGTHVQKETMLLGVADIADLGIRVGPCTRDTFNAASERAELRSAIKKGAGFLGYGGCSPKALAQKMVSKGISRDVAVRAVEELIRRRYMDPKADALREAERCVGKLWGRKRIVMELRKKGYEDTDIKSALYALEDGETDFSEICAERIKRTVKRPPADTFEKKKLVMTLERYGFTFSEIKEGLAKAFR